MITDPVALMAFMFVLIACAVWLEKRVAVVQKISSVMTCTLFGIVLSNVGVMPHTSPAYDGVNAYAVPYAIVLVILASNLRDLRTAGRAMVACFALATVGSFVGALAAGVIFASWLGPETWKLSGQFAATFVGGSMNFIAVGRGLDTEPATFAAAAVADNLSTVPWILIQVALVGVLARFYRAHAGSEDLSTAEQLSASIRDRWYHADLSVTGMAILGALPLAILWASTLLSPLLPGFPPVLWQTTLALAVAQVPAIRRVNGPAVLSYFVLHLFFVVIGASAVLGELVQSGAVLVVYMITIIAIHAVIVYGGGRLLNFDLPTITIASQATVGGPASALALSMSMKWPSLVTPGTIVGILGYAIGNYVGFACAYTTRALLR